MTTNLKTAQELLFGKEGLGASNFKMFPGTDRDATVSEVSAEIAASLHRLADDKLEVVELDD